jgi:hypothetical protein
MILNAQEKDMTKKIKDAPYAFEGIITNVEIYPGDKNGNRLSDNSIKSEDGVDYFYQEDGSSAIGYSLATIKLCKVYNGSEIENEDSLYILTSNPQMLLFKQEGQIRYLNVTNFHSTDFILMPASKEMKYLFFCTKNAKNQFIISDKDLLISFNLHFEEETSGITKSNVPVKYAQGLNTIFYTKDELKRYFSKISGLNTDAKDKCATVKKVLLETKTKNQ